MSSVPELSTPRTATQHPAYRRIMIFGRPGSGKSTFAHRLARAIGYPLYHLDKYFYAERWTEQDQGELLSFLHQMVGQECWIIDGNSTRLLEQRWQRADLVLYFNVDRWTCLYRLVKRWLYKSPHIDDRASNCPDALCYPLLKYMWGFESHVSHKVSNLREIHPNSEFHELNRNEEIEDLFQHIFHICQ